MVIASETDFSSVPSILASCVVAVAVVATDSDIFDVFVVVDSVVDAICGYSENKLHFSLQYFKYHLVAGIYC